MRTKRHVVQLGQRADAARRGQAADLRDLGLQIGERSRGEQAIKVFQGVLVFTASQIAFDGGAHAGDRGMVPHGPHRLFEPRDTQLAQSPAYRNRFQRIELSIDIDHDLDGVTELVAQHGGQLRVDLVQFDCGESCLHGARGFGDQALGFPQAREARVAGNAVAHRSAEKSCDANAQTFAFEVPQSQIHAR